MKERRSYTFPLWINGRLLLEVVIDPHHEKKHPDISDALILEIVRGLDGREFQMKVPMAGSFIFWTGWNTRASAIGWSGAYRTSFQF